MTTTVNKVRLVLSPPFWPWAQASLQHNQHVLETLVSVIPSLQCPHQRTGKVYRLIQYHTPGLIKLGRCCTSYLGASLLSVVHC